MFDLGAGGGVTGLAATPDGGRVRVGLILPVRRRVVDVSIQPGAVEGAVTGSSGATHGRCAPSTGEVACWLRRSAEVVGNDHVPAGDDLVAVAGAAAFPLLGVAYRCGAAAEREVPRWACPVLTRSTARDAARAAFGVRAATRPVVGALASALLPGREGGPVRFGPLALALMGCDVLEPDDVARLLRQASEGPIVGWPSPESLAAARTMFAALGRRGALGVLGDVAARPDGFPHLAIVLVAYHGALSVPTRPANRLDEFAAQVVAGLPVDPHPEPPVSAPRAPSPWPPPLGVHGRTVADLRLVEPRTEAELAAWGRLLGNCLATYAEAQAAGRSRLVGVERQGRLRYCLELTGDGTLRQFLGERNRPVPASDRRAVLDVLRACGVLRRAPTRGDRALLAPR
ncbi:MAG: PcfJ domain-containing protein [Acidimicrobiales bacterium]|nr:PcfJ domain-containing protein [Acidimicrobiales bacterium]